MLSAERQRRLLQHLRVHGVGNVSELANDLGVSASTIRRDLGALDGRGLLTRVHGGASLLDSELEPGLGFRTTTHNDRKCRIGLAAADLVSAGATVLITGGTTTECMLPHLAGRELTVVTNGLNIALKLTRYPDISVVVLGGLLRHREMSLLGPIAEQVLGEFHVDVAFTGAFGIEPDVGISGAHVQEAGTDRRILQAADALVVLVDSSKFGTRGPVRLAGIDRIRTVITDADAPRTALAALRRHGVDVVTC